MIRGVGVLGLGLWDGPVFTNDAFGSEFASHARVHDPYRGRRGDDGIVRVAGVELVPGQHDRTIAEIERSYADPFRGTRRRRWLPADLPISQAETEAARNALTRAAIEPAEIDAVLTHSFLPDGLNPKNAPLIARELGITEGLALEVDSVCNSTLSQMLMGASLIVAGQAQHVLCTQSIAYSRLRDGNASSKVLEADMASAFVLGPVAGAEMSFSWRTAGELHAAISLEWRRPTNASSAAYWEGSNERLLISFDRELQQQVNDIVADYARLTCREALGVAETSLEETELFVTHQPMSWFKPYMEDTLGLPDGVAFSTFEEYANINSPSVTASLHDAALAGRLQRGARVLLYCPAAGYTFGAVAMRW